MDAPDLQDLTALYHAHPVMVLVLGTWSYSLPSMIGTWRRRPDLGWLCLFNLLWGMTGLGWVAAMGWTLLDARD